MDTFKVMPGTDEETLISEENFVKRTKKKYPYFSIDHGRTRYKAVCPMCDNPIQIIGLYKKEEDSTTRPYGRHTKSDLPGVAIYNEEDYLSCPYHNPNRKLDNAKRRPGDPKSNYLYQQMKEHFDLIIKILEQNLHIFISYNFAKDLLRSWKNNEGWRYYRANYQNLSFMLLYAERSYTMFGKLIRKDSRLEKMILKNGRNFAIQNTDMEYYDKIIQKSGFLNAVFYITNHQFVRNEEHTEESYDLVIVEDEKEICKETIIIKHGQLHEMIEKQMKRNQREERLIEIANEILH